MELLFEPVPEVAAAPSAEASPTRPPVTHYLVLPNFVDPADIEFLIQCQFPQAKWLTEPREAQDGPDSVTLHPGRLYVGSHSVFEGPFLSTPEHPAGFGDQGVGVYALVTNRERGAQPVPGAGDRDGLGRVFPAGLPIRQELRTAQLLVALARHLSGSVIFSSAGAGVDAFATVTPDPQAGTDLTIFCDVWLEPVAALAVAQRVEPGAHFGGQGEEWAGPAELEPSIVEQVRAELEPEIVAHIHAVADENDLDALAADEVSSAYAIFVADLHGIVAVEIGGTDEVPAVLDGMNWAETGVLEYRISWTPSDLFQWHTERPSPEFVAQRAYVHGIIRALAAQFYAQTGGEIADEYGFLIDPQQL